MAANNASNASAKIDVRSIPPLFNSPIPKFKVCPNFNSRAISAKVASLTNCARSWDKRPSDKLGKASNNILAMV